MSEGSVSEALRAAVRSSALGQNEIARLAGLDRGMFSRFLSGRAGLGLGSVDRLAKVLGLRLTPGPRRASKGKRKDRGAKT